MRQTWHCDQCKRTLTTYVRVTEPPTHVCSASETNRNTSNIQPMKERKKK